MSFRLTCFNKEATLNYIFYFSPLSPPPVPVRGGEGGKAGRGPLGDPQPASDFF